MKHPTRTSADRKGAILDERVDVLAGVRGKPDDHAVRNKDLDGIYSRLAIAVGGRATKGGLDAVAAGLTNITTKATETADRVTTVETTAAETVTKVTTVEGKVGTAGKVAITKSQSADAVAAPTQAEFNDLRADYLRLLAQVSKIVQAMK